MFAWRRAAVRRDVLVNLRTGKAIRGVMWASRGPLLVLKDAELVEANGSPPIRLDGDVIVERSNLDFVQVIPAGRRDEP